METEVVSRAVLTQRVAFCSSGLRPWRHSEPVREFQEQWRNVGESSKEGWERATGSNLSRIWMVGSGGTREWGSYHFLADESPEADGSTAWC